MNEVNLEIFDATLKIWPSRTVLQRNPRCLAIRMFVHGLRKEVVNGQNRGHQLSQLRVNKRSSATAEKGSEGMA